MLVKKEGRRMEEKERRPGRLWDGRLPCMCIKEKDGLPASEGNRASKTQFQPGPLQEFRHLCAVVRLRQRGQRMMSREHRFDCKGLGCLLPQSLPFWARSLGTLLWKSMGVWPTSCFAYCVALSHPGLLLCPLHMVHTVIYLAGFQQNDIARPKGV